jgi:hypothetical protein
MNIIQNLLNGNISYAQKLARNRSFFWLCQKGNEMGLAPLERWNISMFLKGLISWEEYNNNKANN